jgi:chitinase
MKNILLALVCLTAVSAFASHPQKQPVVVAYLISSSKVMPNPAYVTHIMYSFAHVDSTFAGIKISNENFLSEVMKLKQQKPSLKICLSIGGWGSGGFSEMAADEQHRKAFVSACRQAVEKFGLDGIDIDWEYPTSDKAKISSSPDDTKNFTLLMHDLRKALGKKKVLTAATVAEGLYIDMAAIAPYVDFVNIMTYCIDEPPYHHAALFRSDMTHTISSEESVLAHAAKGLSEDKLVLGIPFFGILGKDEIAYKNIIKLQGYTRQWDDVAKVPYLADSTGRLMCTYEDSASIGYKCDFIRKHHLRGAMYWEYSEDDANLTLTKAVYNGIFAEEKHSGAQ